MADTKRARILIADDSEINIMILREFLGDDYDVVTATDGEQALQRIGEEPPDLVLLDILMPGLDGYQVCGKLKGDERTAEIPVIFITALDDAAAESRGLELGAIDFITKPFNPAVVMAGSPTTSPCARPPGSRRTWSASCATTSSPPWARSSPCRSSCSWTTT